MPKFTIERQYLLPVYRHETYEAESLEAACALDAKNHEWENAQEDYDCSRDDHIAAAWEGEEAYPSGQHAGLPVPPEYARNMCSVFDQMLAALKLAAPVCEDAEFDAEYHASNDTAPDLLDVARKAHTAVLAAIAEAEKL